jgi:hypothetical protein
VGVLAHVVRYFRTSSSLPFDAFVVFLSLTVLGVLLLSNRLRRKLRVFVGEHFRVPRMTTGAVWMESTQRTVSILDSNELCAAASKLVSESLEIPVGECLAGRRKPSAFVAGGFHGTLWSGGSDIEKAGKSAPQMIKYLREHPRFLDLTEQKLAWPDENYGSGRRIFSANTACAMPSGFRRVASLSAS